MSSKFQCLLLLAQLWVGYAKCQTILSAQPLLASSTLRQPCPTGLSNPIAIPLRNVTAAGRMLRRDLSISVGTPPQLMAFDVSFERKYIYVNDGQASCAANDTTDKCMVRFGGLFDGVNSSTYHFYEGLTAPGLGQSSDSYVSDDTCTDNLLLNPSLSLTASPIRLNRVFDYLVNSYNYLGLSPDSFLMKSLVASTKVSSNTISYYSGWYGAEITDDVDGNLVLGGYDRAKIGGPNITQSISRTEDIHDCQNGFKLRLTDISLNLKNGRNISIMNNSDEVQPGCIDTVSDSIRVTPSLWSNFLRISGSTETGRVEDGFNREGFLVDADTAYAGDITIHVDPHIEIRIPNHQLIMPVYGVDTSGHLYVNDTKNKRIRLWTDTNPPGPPEEETIALGRSFMSSTYLLVDYDRGNYTIWPSRATNETDLVPIGAPNCNGPMSATPSNSNIQHKLSTGVLAGSIIGGCSGLVLLIAISCFLLSWNKKQKRQRSNNQMEAEKNLNWWRRCQQAQGPLCWQSKPELPDNPWTMPVEIAAHAYHEGFRPNRLHVQQIVHESPGDLIVHELPAHEVSSELPLTRRTSEMGLAI